MELAETQARIDDATYELMRACPVPALRVAPDHIVRGLNAACLGMLGVAGHDAVGQSWFTALNVKATREALAAATRDLSARSGVDVSVVLREPVEATVPVHLIAASAAHPKLPGDVVLFVCVDRLSTSQRAEVAERMRARTNLPVAGRNSVFLRSQRAIAIATAARLRSVVLREAYARPAPVRRARPRVVAPAPGMAESVQEAQA